MAKKNPLTIAREGKGWSIEDLAKKTNLPPATIRRLESTLTSNHHVAQGVVEKVVAAFGQSAETLFTQEQLRPPRRVSQRGRQSRQGVICKNCQTEIPLIHGRTCPDCQ